MKLQDYSLDDLHLMATGEFADEPTALVLLNQAYSENRMHYLMTLYTLRAAKADREGRMRNWQQ